VIPKLWHQTIEAHRRGVRDAILDITAALVAQHGLRSVTMSQIAEETGIGRATLYKYFTGVEPILVAWHQRHVAGHLEHLTELLRRPGAVTERLGAVVEAYALICFERRQHGADLGGLVHQSEYVSQPHHRLERIFLDLLTEAAQIGGVRGDVPPGELATYCLHALEASGSLPSRTAVQRLVTVVLAGLDAPSSGAHDTPLQAGRSHKGKHAGHEP